MKPRPSMLKKQREQAKRDKKIAKAERKSQRSAGEGVDASEVEEMQPLSGPSFANEEE